jgi:hypothetical protein
VLVIIGLIVGGVLTGQSLISAAEVRAQITQIEKYQTAVNTFRSKFNAIPGDMPGATASQFGFIVGTSCNGQTGGRDGNGLLEGINPWPLIQTDGEPALFWQDLSSSVAGNLIDVVIPNSGGAILSCWSSVPSVPITIVGDYLPVARIGKGNFIYTYQSSGQNWYGLSSITSITSGFTISQATIPVFQSYNIDIKIDDGLPTTGSVQTNYINSNLTVLQHAPNTSTSGGTSSSCYDTTTGTYSVTVNNGNGGNCALSFKFQ